MAVTGEIKTGSRTNTSYLLSRLLNTGRKACGAVRGGYEGGAYQQQ
jgi:hypothetical protein